MVTNRSVGYEAGDLTGLRTSFRKVMRDRPIDDTVKGFPFGVKILFSEISQMGWNLLRGDLPLPCAVLRASALRNNSTWMQDFLRSRGAVIAPHAKTTLSPQIIQLQLDDGAWGMTVSTVHQLRTCLRIGVRRLILANQMVAAAEQAALFAALIEYPELDLYCLADSIAIVETLEATGARVGAPRPLGVLLEVGYPGGRTGCRSRPEALEIARAIHHNSHLHLAGIEAFEGLLMFSTYGEVARNEDSVRVRNFLGTVVDVFGACKDAQLFDITKPILTAGGSAFYDLVTDIFAPTGACVVTRSGCYVSHDSGLFEQLQARLMQRIESSEGVRSLEPALEIWAAVQSMPENGLAIISAGRRDVGADAGWPRPLRWAPAGSTIVTPLSADHRITGLNDQHGYMVVPSNTPLQVGSRVALGISHPCTTFDKWQLIFVVDDSYNVVEPIETCF